MSRFLEWRLRLGPLRFGMGFRAMRLDDALPGAQPPALAPADSLAVGKVRLLDESPPADERGTGSVD